MTVLQKFISARPQLAWYVANVAELDDASVVEHVLNYGTWADVQALMHEYGVHETAAIFAAHARMPRSNYRAPIKTYFTHYFNAHAH